MKTEKSNSVMKSEFSINQSMEARLERFSRQGRPLHKDQKRFLQIAAITGIFCAIWFLIGKHTLHFTPESWDTYPDRLAFLMRVMVFVTLPLLMGITSIAFQRLDPRNVIGQKLRTDTPADINKRFLANTIEQTLLFFFVHSAIVYYSPADEAISTILLASLFIVGRLIFWIGYHKDKFTRALGFGITFYPIVGAYMWVMIRIIFDYHIPL